MNSEESSLRLDEADNNSGFVLFGMTNIRKSAKKVAGQKVKGGIGQNIVNV